MTCPDPIAESILEILKCGILQTRSAAWSGDSELCAALADHLHNLPDLLANYSEDTLIHYLEVEQPVFFEAVDPDISEAYQKFWNSLRTECNIEEPAGAKQ